MSKQAEGSVLKDGEAMDMLTDRAERWAAKYKNLSDSERWRSDYDEHFDAPALQLAKRCTLEARPFGVKDWILALVLWFLIGGTVFLASNFLMQLEPTWQIVFAVFAVLIAVVGIMQSYLETTSERRAAKRLAGKKDWLLSVSRKAAMATLSSRAGATA
ncbi:hypothetical protein C5E06_05590 [Pseudoclavibacter sp. RFBI5]|uniref:hypothetical protein n=1 Tax=Pseudoclavibacter sp. RFBI5 TaxID=2080578 RepID=UPI000CE76225|nr:hypothetical protein [Pseudoclavibacter sp. RFBI5]PPG04265.1 hypothetical protein C5E06_05590 [Pseudoclavibacter sp. RFBI5]